MLAAQDTHANKSVPSLLELIAIDPESNRKTRILTSGETDERDVADGLMRVAIFGTDGNLVAVLGIASMHPELVDNHQAAIATTVARPEIEVLPPLPAVYPEHRVPPPAPARGGLPPKTLRRVREYIDAHLEESISLKDLADIAGLSMFHFARAFKQSQGQTPNCYTFQRRVERAQTLLADTDLPLSEIAIATGLSDQSHFARRFRDHVGTTPARYRWSKR